MFRASRAAPAPGLVTLLLTPLLVLALLLSADAIEPPVVDADGRGPGPTAIRQQQLRAEATMLRADQQVKRLQRQRRQHKQLLRAARREFERTVERRDRVQRRLERAATRRDRAGLVFDRAVRVRPNPRGVQVTDKPRLRRQLRKLERRTAVLTRELRQRERQLERARQQKQSRWKKVSRARIIARKAARERAEDRLGTSILAMLELSQARADRDLRLAKLTRFRRPASGRVTQPYGCTGYRTNPRRGGCAHFHDGVDIAAQRGARVRASADGYVAYVGRNPWDKGRRSYVVIIGHPGGYHSVYAHLKPRRLIRAGQRVDAGDRIGKVGITGRTTGPHVHWEVWRDGRTLDPLRARR